jgi:hypothetical protein
MVAVGQCVEGPNLLVSPTQVTCLPVVGQICL